VICRGVPFGHTGSGFRAQAQGRPRAVSLEPRAVFQSQYPAPSA
jgi:hypothetical protein